MSAGDDDGARWRFGLAREDFDHFGGGGVGPGFAEFELGQESALAGLPGAYDGLPQGLAAPRADELDYGVAACQGQEALQEVGVCPVGD